MNKVVCVLALLGAFEAHAQVGHKCVDNCDAGPPPSSGSSGGGAGAPRQPTMQDAMMSGAMQGLQQGITNLINKKKQDQDKAQQEAETNRQRLEQQGAEEKSRANQSNNELMSEMLTTPDAPAETGKVIGRKKFRNDIFDKPPGAAVSIAFETPVNKKIMMMDCEVSRLLALAEKMGPEGKKQADAVREELNEARADLGKPASPGADSISVHSPGIDLSIKDARSESSLVAKINIIHHDESGDTTLDVQYHYSSGKKTEEGQTVVSTDQYGNIIKEESSGEVKQCLKKFH